MNNELKNLAKEEAENLRKNATKKELSHLSLADLDASNVHSCIYGQLTGSCFSTRAHKLIDACCTKVYKVNPKKLTNLIKSSTLGDKPEDQIVGYLRKYAYFSPLEKALLYMTYNQKSNLISYLKGETNKLW